MKYDVYGLGNPLIDVIIPVTDDLLEKLVIQKGSMNLVDSDRQAEILGMMKAHQIDQVNHALGGSAANSIVLVSQLGGMAAYQGSMGHDDFGHEYERQLVNHGVTSFLSREEGNTGSTVILVTPDADRTMNTHLGKCQDLHPDHINYQELEQSKYLYVEGYLWDTKSQQEAVMAAVRHAKEKGVKVALSLSDPFCVERHKSAFMSLMENYVDLVFCNEEEGKHMTGKELPHEVVEELGKMVPHVALTLGKKGALIHHEGDHHMIEAFEVEALDTTGAGDAFAAGYLFGITQGYEPHEAGRLGSKAASVIVTAIGPRFHGDIKEALQEVMK